MYAVNPSPNIIVVVDQIAIQWRHNAAKNALNAAKDALMESRRTPQSTQPKRDDGPLTQKMGYPPSPSLNWALLTGYKAP